MIPVIPGFITAVVIVSAIAIATAVWGVLSLATGRSGLPSGARRRVWIGSGAFLAAWLGAILVSADSPASQETRDPFLVAPLIPISVGLSIVGFMLAYRTSPSLRRVLAGVPLPALHALQSWRILGVVFVILHGRGQLPGHFALPAGWGDVAIGLTAPWVALALARRMGSATAVAVSWNLVGLLDLAVAVGMGTGLLAPLFAPQLGPRVPPAAAMGVLPMVLVPAFAVPASALIHALALVQMGRARRVFDEGDVHAAG